VCTIKLVEIANLFSICHFSNTRPLNFKQVSIAGLYNCVWLLLFLFHFNVGIINVKEFMESVIANLDCLVSKLMKF
jgi:hypothetical protein